jgi:hypothetical protein
VQTYALVLPFPFAMRFKVCFSMSLTPKCY